jgi:hypothetical protein
VRLTSVRTRMLRLETKEYHAATTGLGGIGQLILELTRITGALNLDYSGLRWESPRAVRSFPRLSGKLLGVKP